MGDGFGLLKLLVFLFGGESDGVVAGCGMETGQRPGGVWGVVVDVSVHGETVLILSRRAVTLLAGVVYGGWSTAKGREGRGIFVKIYLLGQQCTCAVRPPMPLSLTNASSNYHLNTSNMATC